MQPDAPPPPLRLRRCLRDVIPGRHVAEELPEPLRRRPVDPLAADHRAHAGPKQLSRVGDGVRGLHPAWRDAFVGSTFGQPAANHSSMISPNVVWRTFFVSGTDPNARSEVSSSRSR